MPFVVRQSDLKTWSRCPLQYRYQNVDKLPRKQSGALTFGTIIHECVLRLEVTQSIDEAIELFKSTWENPTLLSDELVIDYYVKGTSWAKYAKEGERILRGWWEIIQWESDVVLGREFGFLVPIGDGHLLQGTIDKLALRYMPSQRSRVVLISDYKTTRKEPTYDWLADDLQFSAYCYATTRPEFWAPFDNGDFLFSDLRDLPRWGEWVQLLGPKRKDAGIRTQQHYGRLIVAVNELARSVEHDIYVPNISGDTCRYCEYRELCGLEEIANFN